MVARSRAAGGTRSRRCPAWLSPSPPGRRSGSSRVRGAGLDAKPAPTHGDLAARPHHHRLVGRQRDAAAGHRGTARTCRWPSRGRPPARPSRPAMTRTCRRDTTPSASATRSGRTVPRDHLRILLRFPAERRSRRPAGTCCRRRDAARPAAGAGPSCFIAAPSAGRPQTVQAGASGSVKWPWPQITPSTRDRGSGTGTGGSAGPPSSPASTTATNGLTGSGWRTSGAIPADPTTVPAPDSAIRMGRQPRRRAGRTERRAPPGPGAGPVPRRGPGRAVPAAGRTAVSAPEPPRASRDRRPGAAADRRRWRRLRTPHRPAPTVVTTRTPRTARTPRRARTATACTGAAARCADWRPARPRRRPPWRVGRRPPPGPARRRPRHRRRDGPAG